MSLLGHIRVLHFCLGRILEDLINQQTSTNPNLAQLASSFSFSSSWLEQQTTITKHKVIKHYLLQLLRLVGGCGSFLLRSFLGHLGLDALLAYHFLEPYQLYWHSFTDYLVVIQSYLHTPNPQH